MSDMNNKSQMHHIDDRQFMLWKTDCMSRQYREIKELKAKLRLAQCELSTIHKGQSHRMSMIESLSNVVVGFGVSMLANLLILPLFGYSPGIVDAGLIGAVFTVISLIRSYLMRRLFNWIGVRHALAAK